MKMRKTVNAEKNLTEGKILKTMLIFALPMILGNLLQQVYNIADTMVVGRFLGAEALAAVGSAYTLMTFLTSVIIGLCMGSGAVFSIAYGAGNQQELKKSIWVSFVFVGIVTIVMNAAVFIWTRPILKLLQIPEEVYPLMYQYIRIIFSGILFVFLYNFFACLLRAVGNSVVPLWFLAVSSVLNIILDLWFVAGLGKGVEGAAAATVIAQMAAGIGIAVYTLWRVPVLRIEKQYMRMEKSILNRVMQYSVLTCAQQSVMNFGILMIQGLVNSFGTVIMAAFAVAVKIDTLAYMPAQEFGNAFSLFVSQNYGARKYERIRKASEMAAGHPCLGIHQNSTVNTYVIGIGGDEFLPPCFLYVILKFHTQIAIIPGICQTSINLGSRINETSRFGKCHNFFHCFFHFFNLLSV